MPTITLTDLAVRNLKPVAGKRVTYLDKSLKGFGVRITENGIKTFVLTYGEDRKRVKLGDVGLIRLADAREKAKDILGERQFNGASDAPSVSFDDRPEEVSQGLRREEQAFDRLATGNAPRVRDCVAPAKCGRKTAR